MLARISYSLKICWKYRAQVAKYATDPQLQLPTILSLTRDSLVDSGVKALILDFDGVLASHAEPQPRAEVVLWLQTMAGFPDFRMYILSNKPRPERLEFFAQYFPQIKFIVAPRKKPYPDGIQEIIRLSNLKPQQLLLIDDRIAIGMALAASTGIQARLITKPYINLAKRPLRELGFMFLRSLERIACRIA